ncbi:uncharacterized protein LOC123550291 isoform X1 [Mercenaria mercenaria]|uniref:uncharacterized protein LOC123550291 isoform X1 n=1 Tax=Mercenaria mercenaria TaxID=6596 RepID=UPI00234EA38E|nr:uncharacterized protein LOC123550291 isoform X1 [Mercenaria mercenaria]
MKADDNEDEITVESGECKGITFAPQMIDEKSWFPVDERKTMFVFSAFYIKGRKKVFIIGAKQIVSTITICQYWYQYERSREMFVKEKQSLVRMPREGQNKKYTSTIFECGLGTSRMPSYISVVTKSCETPLNILRVKNVSKPEGYKNRFAVCLSPLYFNYSRAYELVEWIELNRILGAEKFVIYNISTSINVNQVLAYYSKRGLVQVMQWRLPMRVATYPRSKEPTEIHYFGQTAALNDCLFRSKGDSEYLVNVDLVEFIIPHGNNQFNWTDAIKPFAEKSNVFLLKSTYFRKEWENNTTDFPDKYLIQKLKLVTLQIYEHEGRIFPA